MQSIFYFLLTAALLVGCGEKITPAKNAADGEAHAETASQGIALDDTALRDAGIAIETAAPAALKETLTLYGIVQPNAERTRQVAARFPGVVKAVAKNIGDRVGAGDTLATIESNDSLQVYAVKAPIAGTVTARHVQPGETVAEQALFTITDLSTVWIELTLFARDVAQVHVGQDVAVAAVDGGLQGNGRIRWVAALGSADTQSLAARVQLDNDSQRWTPGLYVSGDVTLAERPVALAVRSTALQRVDGDTVVFVALDDTAGDLRRFAARAVKIGRSDATFSEIVAGLAPNDRVATANSFVLKAELEKSAAEHDH